MLMKVGEMWGEVKGYWYCKRDSLHVFPEACISEHAID